MQKNANSKNRSLGKRVAAGVAWMVGMRWVARVLGVISTLVLARILMPEDFGLVALAVSYVAILEGLTVMPMGQALIRFQNPGRLMYDTAWTLSVIRGLIIVIIMLVSAKFISNFMEEPRLVTLIYILSIPPLISSFSNPRFIDFEKKLLFAWPAILQVGTKFLQVLVTIGTAIILKSYWALVVGGFVSAIVHLIMSYVLMPYRPRVSIAEASKLWSFSGWLTATSILHSLNDHADKFVIGAILGVKYTGIFHVGKDLSTLPNQQVIVPLNKALFPAFSLLSNDPVKLKSGVLEAITIVSAISVPLSLGFALLAEEFVLLILGEKWLQVVPIIHVMVPLLAFAQLMALMGPVFMALGRTRIIFYMASIRIVLRACLMIPGALYFGFEGAIYGWAIMLIIFSFVRMYFLTRELKVRFLSPIIVTWRSWFSVAVMAVSVLSIEHLSPYMQFIPAPDDYIKILGLKIMVGILTYSTVHLGLWYVSGRPPGLENRVRLLLSKKA